LGTKFLVGHVTVESKLAVIVTLVWLRELAWVPINN